MLGKTEALGLWRRCGSLVVLLLLRAFEVLVRVRILSYGFRRTAGYVAAVAACSGSFPFLFSTPPMGGALCLPSAWPRGRFTPFIPRLRLPTSLCTPPFFLSACYVGFWMTVLTPKLLLPPHPSSSCPPPHRSRSRLRYYAVELFVRVLPTCSSVKPPSSCAVR